MTSKPINVHEIKARFSYFAREVLKGKSFILALRNKPFAELRPLVVPRKQKLVFGVLKGKFKVPADFNSPLREFERDYYGG